MVWIKSSPKSDNPHVSSSILVEVADGDFAVCHMEAREQSGREERWDEVGLAAHPGVGAFSIGISA
jgi:hypothetical protein